MCRKKGNEVEEGEVDEEEEHEVHPLVTVTKINPDEIPEVPANRYGFYYSEMFFYYSFNYYLLVYLRKHS